MSKRIIGKQRANQTHYEVGAKVRKTIQELGGTMSEHLPPAGNIKKLEKKRAPKQLPDAPTAE
jgi:DNA-damage-inducible protein D